MESSSDSRACNEIILLVDDKPDNLRLLSQILAERRYTVRAATNGRRALQTVQLDPPDLILLDIRMPGMDGFEVCQALKADEKTRDIPVIFISALDDVADKVRAFKMGGVDYITKPFQYEEVLARVQTHLALCRLQQELARSNRKMARELALAGEVQATFLPDKLPQIEGWQFAVTLQAARQTSGDFYDIFYLPGGKLGLLVADVVDKGVPAALFMALSYALLRTHALNYPDQPECVFEAVNNQILGDTHANQFVTAFLGILDLDSGVMVYSNAGHPPGLIVGQKFGRLPRWLATSGPPLGVLQGQRWQRQEVLLAAQDVLMLYTDGLIEAEENPQSAFGRERLLQSAQAHVQGTADQVKEGLIGDVGRFANGRPLFDDLLLLVVRREGVDLQHSN